MRRRRRREAKLLAAFERLRRHDPPVHDALVTGIRHGGVRLLHAIGVLVGRALHAAHRGTTASRTT